MINVVLENTSLSVRGLTKLMPVTVYVQLYIIVPAVISNRGPARACTSNGAMPRPRSADGGRRHCEVFVICCRNHLSRRPDSLIIRILW